MPSCFVVPRFGRRMFVPSWTRTFVHPWRGATYLPLRLTDLLPLESLTATLHESRRFGTQRFCGPCPKVSTFLVRQVWVHYARPSWRLSVWRASELYLSSTTMVRWQTT